MPHLMLTQSLTRSMSCASAVRGPHAACRPKNGTSLILGLIICLLSVLVCSTWACPDITQTSYSIDVQESTTVGTVLLTVTATADPGVNLTFGVTSIVGGEPCFVIDSATGNLSLSKALNYDMSSSYTIVAYVTSSDDLCQKRVDIDVSVLNENDYAPRCARHVLSATVQENSTAGEVLKLSCTDADNMGLTYQLTSGNDEGIFGIDSDGTIFTTEVLDYEHATAYVLTVLVGDSGFDLQLNATVKVFISIEPRNEYAPEFANSTYEFSASESANVGTLVGQVVATDQDIGPDGAIFYAFLPGEDSDFFTICSTSGDIYLRRALDYEVAISHQFAVIAFDGSPVESDQFTATATVIVHVRDSNEYTPTFDRSIYYAQVPEGDETETGSDVMQLTCTDGDSDPNQALMYAIVSGNEEGKFNVSPSGMIVFQDASLLDYELGTQLFELAIQCTDSGLPSRSSQVTVLLEVTSVNEYTPIPSSIEYEVEVPEDTLPGTSIAQMTVHDQDEGLAGVLSYSITYCPSGLLHISPTDGTVYLMQQLDYEAGPREIICEASVQDSQEPFKDNQVDIIVSVLNVNDNPPVCDPSVRIFTIPEDAMPNFRMTFACDDPDSSNLHYSIPDGWSSVPFQVNPTGSTVVLSLQQQLDYENQSSYSFPIEVSDGEFVTMVGIYIVVTDTNEYTPGFPSDNFYCNVSEGAQVGTLVCETSASDDDGGSLTYRISNRTDNETFLIESLTGVIMLASSLDYEMVTEYNLTVEVSDSGSPAHSSSAVVHIAVEDENDNSPVVIPLVFATVFENATTGTAVALLECRDSDSARNAETSLEISTATFSPPDRGETSNIESPFEINSTSGKVVLNETLDYETAGSYILYIACRDHGSPPLSSWSTVMVEVAPVNEHTPTFELQRYNLSIAESSSIGTSIFHVQASDHDSGKDGEIQFSLNSTDFYLDPHTGVATIARPLDCTKGTIYHCIIVASDGGSPSLSATADIEVHVTNCSVGSLVSDDTFYTASVAENASTESTVLTVSCTGSRELLLGDQSRIHYTLLSTDSSPFEVDAETGKLYVAFSLDYEVSTSHSLTLQCYDPSNTTLDIPAYIAILPVNEHPPEFNMQHYTVEVSEDTILGSRIDVGIQGFDMDEGEDGRITYSIQQTEQTFGIDPTSGTIYLTGSLDYETVKQWSFQVTAEDNPVDEASKMYSHVNITVTVLDSNDNRPECDRNFYHVTTSQLTAIGTTLAVVNCSDEDEGRNAEFEYHIGDDSMAERFAVDRATGEVTLSGALDPDVEVVHLLPIVVRDRGDQSLTSTVTIIVDVQDSRTLIEADYNETMGENQTEVEGRENSVNMVLHDLSLELVSNPIFHMGFYLVYRLPSRFAIMQQSGKPENKWKEAEVNFRRAIAYSVTHYCALLPESCSLAAGCSEFLSLRKKRNDNNYVSFMQPNVNLLGPPTETHDQLDDVTSLEINFYVSLPDRATRALHRETNYVIPRGTLNSIIEQDHTVVEAVVRDSVAPSLTQPEQERSERETPWSPVTTAAVVIAAVLLSVVVVCLVATAVYKYRKRKSSKTRVQPISNPTPTRTRVRNADSCCGDRRITSIDSSQSPRSSDFTECHLVSSPPIQAAVRQISWPGNSKQFNTSNGMRASQAHSNSFHPFSPSPTSSVEFEQPPDLEKASMEPNSRGSSELSSPTLDEEDRGVGQEDFFARNPEADRGRGQSSAIRSLADRSGHRRLQGPAPLRSFEADRTRRQSPIMKSVKEEGLVNCPFTPHRVSLEPRVRLGHARPPGSWGAATMMHTSEFRTGGSRNNHWRPH